MNRVFFHLLVFDNLVIFGLLLAKFWRKADLLRGWVASLAQFQEYNFAEFGKSWQ
ncbi:MAG: hypothetical protein JNL70_00695 [Saprospiraceae bacterium]|nr:hypothetical protein [Saprospiraceae bacterium]